VATDTSRPALIESLLDPRRYPHAAEAVELVETHISWVLLAGDCAYKIKKPVDLGFLDFSSLDRRRHFCEEELRLNRRLAPELYLGVTAITGRPDDPRLDGPGEAIEFAVRMRRFDREQQLDRLLARGGLEPRHIDDLAATLAGFHRNAAVAGPDSPYGSPGHVWQPVAENISQISERLEGDTTAWLADLRRWSEETFARLRPVFEARKREGFVRECHGDAHLANVVLWNGRTLPFDCLEFNPSLRWIDVISEIAFTAMDLADRGRRDLGWRLLNAWLELSGDYAGVGLLRFYLAYRAMVRAKVAIIRLRQAGLTENERESARRQFDEYRDRALAYTRARRPALLLMHGLSGSGKTTVSQQVLESFAAIRLRSDVERKRLYGLAPGAASGSTIDQGIYSREAGERTYEHLARLAGELLAAGELVVVDAAFLERRRRERFRRLAAGHGAAFLILDLAADEALLRERVTQRTHAGTDASEATLDVLARQSTSHEPLTPDESGHVLTLDARRTPPAAELADRIRRRLAAG
jgi:aminoglycoside phosphotransferase family enzyme/predicted kinase